LVVAAKFLVAATNILSVVPNIVAVTKPFFRAYKNYIENIFLSYLPSHIFQTYMQEHVIQIVNFSK